MAKRENNNIIKRIFIPGQIPHPASFSSADIVINTADGTIFTKGNNKDTLRVINNDKNKNVALDGNIHINKTLDFRTRLKSDPSILFLSASNNISRIGIGTTDPKSTIDFKSVEDSTIGTELILRSARTSTTGAFTGDEGGSINFTIDSGSFIDLKTSGSLAKIKTTVNSVGVGGAQGLLAFELSKGVGPDGLDIFKYGYAIGGEGASFAQVQTGSLIIGDFADLAPSTLKMVDFDGTINFQAFEGDITASGDISCSGAIIGNIDGGTF